jgi:FKBP-type peptidyl-prolyl cis-trans isomerase
MKLLVLIVWLSYPVMMLGQTGKSATSQSLSLKTREDSVQYALGIYFGQWMKSNGFINLDLNRVNSGLTAVLQNRPLLLKEEVVVPMITNYQQTLQKDLGRRLESELFTTLKDKPNIGKLPSGVQYLIKQPGKGARPAETDSVMINFKGTLPNGTVFEDTYAKKISVATTPKTLIPGLSEALQLMPVGAIWEVYIPSALAFGEKGNGQFVPPNSAVIMLVELISIKRNN